MWTFPLNLKAALFYFLFYSSAAAFFKKGGCQRFSTFFRYIYFILALPAITKHCLIMFPASPTNLDITPYNKFIYDYCWWDKIDNLEAMPRWKVQLTAEWNKPVNVLNCNQSVSQRWTEKTAKFTNVLGIST